jgi:60 kDa SS-A/Ro ribonucleoprotein
MKTNIRPSRRPTANASSEATLRRSVLSCLLWEDEFYEQGTSIADRIASLCEQVSPGAIAALAIEARTTHHLRHVSLLLTRELIRHGHGRMVADTIEAVIQRADELAELVAIYWKDGRQPLTNPMKQGLARAFTKFSPYSLAKYNREGVVRLRDVLFLCHAKPKDEAQAATWRQLIDGTLAAPDTWEVSLSRGDDKRATFERLLREGSLGYLALLRNLRNMIEAGVDPLTIKTAILSRRGAERVLPFRYVAAARAVPSLEPSLDISLLASLAEMPTLPGHTIVLVDVSGSMHSPLSSRSDLSRADAAAALASIIPCEDLRVFTFSNDLVEVPPRRGMAGIDTILRSQPHGGTLLGEAIAAVNGKPHDRLIVITDEQSQDEVPAPVARQAYLINVASCSRGIAGGDWTRIDGFSENVIRYIAASEAA